MRCGILLSQKNKLWAIFYTDTWEAFAKVLPTKRHVIGKRYTNEIERDNSNTRHHLARFTCRTKVVSQKVDMVDSTLKLWQALTMYSNVFLIQAFQRC